VEPGLFHMDGQRERERERERERQLIVAFRNFVEEPKKHRPKIGKVAVILYSPGITAKLSRCLTCIYRLHQQHVRCMWVEICESKV